MVRGALGAVAVAVAAAAASPALGAAEAPPVRSAATATTAAASARATPPALARFRSCAGFLRHVRRRALAQVGPWGLAGPPVPSPLAPGAAGDRGARAPEAAPVGAAPPGASFSGTNVQEAGVDEPDLVKTDGRTLYAIAGERVQVLDVASGTARRLGSVAVSGVAPTGLMLLGDRLLVIGPRASAGGPPRPVPLGADAIAVALPGAPAATVVAQFDVADPARPRVVSRLTADGALVAARRTGATVRMVLASEPVRLPLAEPASGRPEALRSAARRNRRAVTRSRAAAWLPRVRVLDAATTRTTTRLTGCRAVSRPRVFSGLGTVTVHTVGTEGGLRLLDSDAIMTDADVVYASPAATYVATPRWWPPAAAGARRAPHGSTLIHKLDTSDPARTVHSASGAVRGYPLNQFSLSEHEGHLRVASTEEPAWWTPRGDAGQSLVTVLAERAGRLVRVGEVDGLGRGERIFAVRFIGPRGYVVTFRQVDPLHVVDLSDPARPAVLGELTIPGFSSYLHPIDDTTLIGVGQAADARGRTQGTQVSLFDVADPAAPRRIAQRALDTDWSEAESDHHAFLHWPATGLVVLPAQRHDPDGGTPFLGAVGLNVSRAGGITPIARVVHPGDPLRRWAPVRRALVAGGALYTVSDAGVMASDLTTLAPRAWTPFG
ncbi:beta-propeller domain-containing protein [Miltoncostaea marina]|uniref:beta-propeller domain-containing protein n=1 Tax=Miltoncostaea marina TaxID=2843215 RepID=UPI001C3DCB30|nr:beta-propeller domain-containing protein [Miltoncostaea marina]